MHLAYIWIVSHLSAKNYRNWRKFDEVLTKTNLLSFFWDTVYIPLNHACRHEQLQKLNTVYMQWLRMTLNQSAVCVVSMIHPIM